MSGSFKFGDLVMCDQQGAPAHPGLLAEVRRTDARVQYLADAHSLWAPLSSMRLATPAENAGTLENLAGEILGLLGAAAMEFSRLPPDGRCRLIASHGAFAPEALDRLRDRMGVALLACLVRPEGMHRIQTIVEFPPGAAVNSMQDSSKPSGPRESVAVKSMPS